MGENERICLDIVLAPAIFEDRGEGIPSPIMCSQSNVLQNGLVLTC